MTKLNVNESLTDFYERSFEITKRAIQQHSHLGAGSERRITQIIVPDSYNVVFVAHGASLDTCTRQITGAEPRSQSDFYDVLHNTPYLCELKRLLNPTPIVFQPVLPCTIARRRVAGRSASRQFCPSSTRAMARSTGAS